MVISIKDRVEGVLVRLGAEGSPDRFEMLWRDSDHPFVGVPDGVTTP
jgi:hypothetical protein